MFNMTFFKESKIRGTLKFKKDNNPKMKGLGVYTDVDGVQWDVEAIMGKYICAIKREKLHPYFNDTSDFRNYGYVSQTWHPYFVEIVD